MRTVLTRLGVGVAAATALYAFVLRDRQLHWGASPQEVAGPLPGDAVLDRADVVATRAITIRAGVDDVWPWVAQMGQGRGGLYSYDRLENLAGCRMSSADRVVADWQDVAVGDDFRLHPDVALRVVEVEAPRALVVRGGVGPGGEVSQADQAPPYDFTWAFVLVPQGPRETRLLVRERYLYLARWAALLVEPVSVVSFIMSERMLRGIRDRAEGRVGG